MQWIIFAATSYFLGAITVILDKYLLGSQKVSSPAVYAFYVCLAGMGVLIFAPVRFLFPMLTLKMPDTGQAALSLVSGFFFMVGITALYFAIKKSEASKVTPVVFSVVPVVTMLLSAMLGSEQLSMARIFGVLLLVGGGLLISFDLPLRLKKKKFFAGFQLSLLSGFFQGLSLVALKYVYLEASFFNGYVWTRTGAFISAFLLFLIPAWQKGIKGSFASARRHKKQNAHTGMLFLLNKVFGGSSSALLNLAVVGGSVTLVSSMISLQYVFVLLLALLLGRNLPHIFEERLQFWDWAQKVAAILIIAVGMFLIS